MPGVTEWMVISLNAIQNILGVGTHMSGFKAANNTWTSQSFKLVFIFPRLAPVLVDDEIKHKVHGLNAALCPMERLLKVDVPAHVLTSSTPRHPDRMPVSRSHKHQVRRGPEEVAKCPILVRQHRDKVRRSRRPINRSPWSYRSFDRCTPWTPKSYQVWPVLYYPHRSG
jgi:hypothetical protein